MLKSAFVVAALALGAQPTSPFDTAKKGATVLTRPDNVIAAIAGACPGDMDAGPSDQSACRASTAKDRDAWSGKRVVIDLGAGHEKFLAFATRVEGARARFVWTPIYDVGNGVAISGSVPTRQGKDGQVILDKRPFDVDTPSDVLDSDLQRAASLGQIGIEVVGKLAKPWQLGSGPNRARGVAIDIEAIRLYHSRTGQTLGTSDGKKH